MPSVIKSSIDSEYDCKVLIIGDPGAGKTSLLLRIAVSLQCIARQRQPSCSNSALGYQDGTYSGKFISTIGVDFVSGLRVRLGIHYIITPLCKGRVLFHHTYSKHSLNCRNAWVSIWTTVTKLTSRLYVIETSQHVLIPSANVLDFISGTLLVRNGLGRSPVLTIKTHGVSSLHMMSQTQNRSIMLHNGSERFAGMLLIKKSRCYLSAIRATDRKGLILPQQRYVLT